MSQQNLIIEKVAEEVVNKENIIKYLNVVKNNINLSVLNQCMVYLQNPNAKIVCGRVAWEEMGRYVVEKARPTVLYFPSVTIEELPEEFKIDGRPQSIGTNDIPIYLKEAIYGSSYIPVNGYDYDSTEGDGELPDITLSSTFLDEIISITQGTTEVVDKKALQGEMGKYDRETNTFYFSDAMDLKTDYGKTEFNKTALSLYVDYVMENYNITDTSLIYAVKYILFERYGFSHNIEKPLFVKLNKKKSEEKAPFLAMIQFLTNGIVQDFEGYFLNFDETALINDLFVSADYSDMWIAFDKAAVSIEDEMLKEEMNILKNKLMRTVDGYLDDLLSLKLDKKVYTYPPVTLVIDNIDYLRKERLNLLSL